MWTRSTRAAPLFSSSQLSTLNSQLSLPHRLVKHDAHRRREIQAARLRRHRDGQEMLAILRQQRFRQPFGLPAEDQKISVSKPRIPVGAIRFRRQKKIPRRRRLRGLKRGQRLPHAHFHILPIVEPGTFQLPIVDGKTERLHEMQMRARREAETADIPRVRRNLGLDEDDVQHAPTDFAEAAPSPQPRIRRAHFATTSSRGCAFPRMRA